MKLLSGARNRSASYTVIPERQLNDLQTGTTVTTPAVRAKFREHRLDTAGPDMQQQYREYVDWYNLGRSRDNHTSVEEVQARVEKHLMDHGDWGRGDGRGIFIDNSATIAEHQVAADKVSRCTFIHEIVDEEGVSTTMQCQFEVAAPDKEFCDMHEAVVAAAGSSMEEPSATP